MGQAEPGGHKCIAVMAPVLRCWHAELQCGLQYRAASAGSGAEGSCLSFATLDVFIMFNMKVQETAKEYVVIYILFSLVSQVSKAKTSPDTGLQI